MWVAALTVQKELYYECLLVVFSCGNGTPVLPYRLLLNARLQTVTQLQVLRRAC